ncbi:hypothetical protein ISR92_03560 [Patescibacteria group bacterium]|nr:hypothetical protein [Patescibacteria group bacterium]
MDILNQKGQGFMEVIVAIGIMIIGIVSILILTSYNLTAADYGEKRLIASNLARESIEVIRNIRDSNWLEGVAWDDGLPAIPGDNRKIVKFSESITGSVYALETVEEDLETCNDCKLYVINTIFNHVDTGTFSGFSRQVEFRDICDETPLIEGDAFVYKDITESCVGNRVGLNLSAHVQWKASNGDIKEVVLEDRIFNWR